MSAVGKLNDPWGDLVNYFRELTSARVRYRLMAETLSRVA
jgi:hypothetical protein